MRKIKFRGISQRSGKLVYGQLLRGDKGFNIVVDFKTNEHIKMIPIFKGTQSQYTGLKDKDSYGCNEVYEGDIVTVDGKVRGNIYEIEPRETDIVIPPIGKKSWNSTYKKAVERGFDYSE